MSIRARMRMLFILSIHSLLFCLLDLSIIDKGVLKSPTIIVDLYLFSVLSFVLPHVLLGTNIL